MGHLPFFKFFPADWLQDTQALSLESQGAWMKLICALHVAPDRGVLYWTLDEMEAFLGPRYQEIIMRLHRVADIKWLDAARVVSKEPNASTTGVEISSRRILREELVRQKATERQSTRRHNNKLAVRQHRVIRRNQSVITLVTREKSIANQEDMPPVITRSSPCNQSVITRSSPCNQSVITRSSPGDDEKSIANQQDNLPLENVTQMSQGIFQKSEVRSQYKDKEKEKKDSDDSVVVPAVKKLPCAEAMRLAQILSDRKFENYPNRVPPTEAVLMSWARDAELLNRRDNRSWAEIEELLEWSQRDDFWKSNIWSMATFRKQWNILLAQKQRGGKQGSFVTALDEIRKRRFE